MSRVWRWVRGFGLFWWDFIVGDDWLIAAGIAASLALVTVLAHHGQRLWWLLPVTVPALLTWSLRRSSRP
jgi:hypothetical protein